MIQELALFQVRVHPLRLVKRIRLHLIHPLHDLDHLKARIPVPLADSRSLARRKPRLIHQQQRPAAARPRAAGCQPVPFAVNQTRPERLIRRAVHRHIQPDVDPHRRHRIEHLKVHIRQLLNIDLELREVLHRITRLRQHRNRAVRVIREYPVIRMLRQRAGVEVHILREPVAQQNLFHDEIPVNRPRQRMPHQPRRLHPLRIIRVAYPRMLIVRLKPRTRRHRLAIPALVVVGRILGHPEVAAVCDCLRRAALIVAVRLQPRIQQIRQETERHRVYDMHLVRLNQRHPRGILRDFLDADAVKRRALVPVIHERAAHELIVGRPILHLERPRADWVLERPVPPHIVYGLAAVHEDQPDNRPLILRSETLQRELNRMVVHNVVRLLIFVQIAHIPEHRLLVFHACVAETPLHIRRRHLAPAVMKLHALAQINRYLGEIRRDVVRLRQMRRVQQIRCFALGEAFHKPDKARDGIPRSAGRLARQPLRVAQRPHSHLERSPAGRRGRGGRRGSRRGRRRSRGGRSRRGRGGRSRRRSRRSARRRRLLRRRGRAPCRHHSHNRNRTK